MMVNTALLEELKELTGYTSEALPPAKIEEAKGIGEEERKFQEQELKVLQTARDEDINGKPLTEKMPDFKKSLEEAKETSQISDNLDKEMQNKTLPKAQDLIAFREELTQNQAVITNLITELDSFTVADPLFEAMAKIVDAYASQDASGVVSGIDPEFKSGIAGILDYRSLEEVVKNDFKVASSISLTYRPFEMTTWDIAKNIASAGIDWKRLYKTRATNEFVQDSGQTKVFFRPDNTGKLKLLRIEGDNFFGIKGPIMPEVIPEAPVLDIREIQRQIWDATQALREAYEAGNITGFMQLVHEEFSAEGIPNKSALEDALRLDFKNLRERRFSEYGNDGFSYQSEEKIAVQKVRWNLRFFEGVSNNERLMQGAVRLVFKQGKLYHIEGNRKSDMVFGAWSDVVKQETIVPGGGYVITEHGIKEPVKEEETIVISYGGQVTSAAKGSTSATGLPITIPADSSENGSGRGWRFSAKSLVSGGSADIIFGSTGPDNGYIWRGPGGANNAFCLPEIGCHGSIDFSPTGEIKKDSILTVNTLDGKSVKIKIIDYTKGANGSCTFQVVN
jgi:hypothetical protein